MPLERCQIDGGPGWKFGAAGTCYPYAAGDANAEKAAKAKAAKQGLAQNAGKPPPEGFSDEDEYAAVFAEALEIAEIEPDERLFAARPNVTSCKSEAGESGFRGHGHDVCHVGDDAKQRALADSMRKVMADAPPPERSFALETVDIPDVEIFASGGPYFGQGSPKEGDKYSKAAVTKLAKTTQDAVSGGKMRSVLRIGHSAAQTLAKTLGIAEDELPALGFQENFRVREDGKVLADWRKVPKMLADQILAGRWPTRSVELHNKTIDGEKQMVFGATSILGAKAPAVGTLAEITALHSDDMEPVRAFALAFGETDPEDEPDAEAIVRALNEAVDLARAYLDRVTPQNRDTSGVPTETKKLSEFDDTKIEAFAAAFEIDETDPEKRREAVAAKFAEAKGEPETPADPPAVPEPDKGVVQMSEAEVEVLRAGAEAGRAAAETLRQERVDRKLSEAISDGRLDPAKREKWETFFSESEERAGEMLGELPVNETLLKTYGSDAPQSDKDEDEALHDQAMRQFGLDEYIENGSAA